MAVTDYTVLDGEVVSQVTGGIRRDYVPDPLGSTVALLDNAQAKTDTWEYWPYGEVRVRTGNTATPFQYVGTLGYFRDTLVRTYVRARHYKHSQGWWLSVDQVWPMQPPYTYVLGIPTTNTDPSGLFGYGNWCGPRSGPLPPINDIDKCCKAHDLCVATVWRWLSPPIRCGCDCTVAACFLGHVSSCKGDWLCLCAWYNMFLYASLNCERCYSPIGDSPIPIVPLPILPIIPGLPIGWEQLCFIFG